MHMQLPYFKGESRKKRTNQINTSLQSTRKTLTQASIIYARKTLKSVTFNQIGDESAVALSHHIIKQNKKNSQNAKISYEFSNNISNISILLSIQLNNIKYILNI